MSNSAGATRREPYPYDQALEAARDDPDRKELTNMVYNLPAVCEVFADGEDEDWRSTAITVGFVDTPGAATADVTDIMIRAGWKPDGATFAYNRLHFEEVDDE